MDDLVSIIIPTYNAAQFIVESVESVLKQTYSSKEIIIVDDGSTDDTRSKLDRFIEGKAVRYVYKKNGGPASARNIGISESAGKYIAFLDADDYWIDDAKISKQVAFLLDNKGCGIVGTNDIVFDTNGKEWKNPRETDDAGIRGKILFENQFTQSSVMIPKEVFSDIGLYNEDIPMEDYELWLRIGRKYSFANISDYCVKYRLVHDGRSNKKKIRQFIYSIRFIMRNMHCYPLRLTAILRFVIIALIPTRVVIIKKRLCNVKHAAIPFSEQQGDKK